MKKFLSILSILILLGGFQNVLAQKKSKIEQKKIIVCSDCGQTNAIVISLPKPEYPKTALFVRVSGEVQVEILINKKGNVESAKAIKGHILLQAEAVKAALKARFEPFRLSGKPVKVRGIIVYKFTPDT